jgi:hypothetical protein
MTTDETDNKLLGKVHSQTMRMSDLSRTIMRLHFSSEGRASSIKEYYDLLRSSKTVRDQIVGRESRKTATWLIRTVCKPVNNDGSQIIA